ncbi:hypothetical protein EUTSA_v10019030mg [Eutrema salsugineum]|uniref:Leucine-rich repeat-containing N-terminal plant-type domain-containing protein n=1 Tax=Eutrema salsugineum TaxID=72664 RepID=V4KD70_EUTSA|nr:hypothetical protein EUTSA_v10019030mg [Eutrema salsugineum]
MLLLGQLHGYQSCVEKERNALLQLKNYFVSITREVFVDDVLPTWTNDTKSNCCGWDGLRCNLTSGRVTEIALSGTYPFLTILKENSLLNLSLLHPFEDVRSLNFSGHLLSGLFDDVEVSFPFLTLLHHSQLFFLGATTWLTLFLLKVCFTICIYIACPNSFRDDVSFLYLLDSISELKDLTNLELLDLSENRYNGSILVREITSLRKLKALDLSGNEFSGSMDLQGKFAKILFRYGSRVFVLIHRALLYIQSELYK